MAERPAILRLSWLVVLAALVWLYLAPDADRSAAPRATVESRSGERELLPQEAPGASAASALPCDVPLAWRVGEIDDRFELSAAEVERAVRRAAASWERAAGRPLFSPDPAAGLPIHLVFDERQRVAVERGRRDRELARSRAQIEARRAEIVELREQLERDRARYESRVRDLERRAAAHNQAVSRWNERGRVPAEVREEMRAERAEIDAEKRALAVLSGELRTRGDRLSEAEKELQRRIDEHNRRSEQFDRTSPPIPVEAGMYSEHARMRNGRVVSVDERQIEIYMVPDGDALARVAAHELGHALGLGHATEPAAVMGEVYDFRTDGENGLELHAADVELLRARCPELRKDRG